MDAKERIKEALVGKTYGLRGEKDAQQMVMLNSNDVVVCCNAIPTPDATIEMLKKGSLAAGENKEIVIYADDAFHIVEMTP